MSNSYKLNKFLVSTLSGRRWINELEHFQDLGNGWRLRTLHAGNTFMSETNRLAQSHSYQRGGSFKRVFK